MNIEIRIAEIGISILVDSDLHITSSFVPFISDSNDWNLYIQSVSILPKISSILLYHNDDYEVFENNNNLKIVYLERDSKAAYAISTFDNEHKIINLIYLPWSKRFFSELSNCFYHSSWEKIMILEGRIIMHAACVQTNYGGVLFSGPSGIGKSTQADLWQKYENAELINGDRTILAIMNNSCYAYGSPYAGSSKCYKNMKSQVKMIVMLKQAPDCSIRRLYGSEAFKRLYAMMTVYAWDSDFTERAIDMTMNLASFVPVYELSCTPDINAVETLKLVLEKL